MKTNDHNKKPKKCKFCDEIFMTYYALNIHLEESHGNLTKFCEPCNKHFQTPKKLKNHIRNVHKGGKHECKSCNKCFTKPSSLNLHIKSVHEGIKSSPLNNKTFQCEICGKEMKHEASLVMHNINVHQPSKNLPCNICKKTYPNKYKLKAHKIKVHEKSVCTICGKSVMQTFIKQHMIAIHSINNETEEILKCEICQKEFGSRQFLNKHMITHTGLKPYKCKHCGQGFSDSSNRLNHEKAVHKGIKRFQKRKVISDETSFL